MPHPLSRSPTADELELLGRAELAMDRADPIHSGLSVGAAVRSAAGAVYAGGNFENDSYGLTICAERAAVAQAVAAEGGGLRLDAVAVAGRKAGRPVAIVSPCGACRQVIYQYGVRHGHETVVVFSYEGTPLAFLMSDLLPVGFKL
jgi:cytidine deaminase